jgi:hypothetical protein
MQPLHFFVEDGPIRALSLTQWSDALSRQAAEAEHLLCSELKRAEKVSVCDVSFREVRITPFERSIEDGLFQAMPQGSAPGVVDENGVNFLLDQESPDERRVYVVRRLLSCGGEKGIVAGCTRMRGRASVIAGGGLDAITLLHELGHQAGLHDGPDPRSLMYRGWPAHRVGTGIKAAEIAYFRRLLSPP